LPADVRFVEAGDHTLEYALTPGDPMVVFLHEGLGSLAMWKDFPARLATRAKCGALVYSRYGYGRSDELREPRGVDFMHREAEIALPDLLQKLSIDRPVLFGHSDGASIALIYAASHAVRGVIVLAPHLFVEEYGLKSIRAIKAAYASSNLKEKLARYHDHPDSAFRGWNDIWLHPDFPAWKIEAEVARNTAPWSTSIASRTWRPRRNC
jgi:pimeloyl-ACP methyl ester carboxylesterase